MSDGIKLVYDFTELDKCIKSIGNVIRETSGISQNLVQIRRHIDKSWEGAADRAYGERCAAILEKLAKLTEQMEINRDKLTNAVGKYRANEVKQVQNVHNLSDEDIF